ncbi:MAG: nucleoside monophosphate kinase [Candidatus Eremiobacteraeota bacterium]|nr:nucleoside monophosphate kinase [Candidatus Eremiobacteraeota bacterium]
MEIKVDHHMYFLSSQKPRLDKLKARCEQGDLSGLGNISDKTVKSAQQEDPGLIPNIKMTGKAEKVEDKKETIPVHNMFIGLTGSPGAGKSTQGRLLAARYGIPHISVGKLLRKEIADKTTYGLLAEPYVKRGDLAPSNLVAAIVKNRLSNPDCKNGFLLDGYPRRMEDTKNFEGVMKELEIKNFNLIGIRVKPDTVIERLKYRRVCPKGHSYDLKNSPPKKPGICDHDGLKLRQRADDKPETIKHRFGVYHNETIPVINYFKNKGLYKEINGNGSIEQVNGKLTDILDPKEEEVEKGN